MRRNPNTSKHIDKRRHRSLLIILSIIALGILLQTLSMFIWHMDQLAQRRKRSRFLFNYSVWTQDIHDAYQYSYKNKVCVLMPTVGRTNDSTLVNLRRLMSIALRSLNETLETQNFTYHLYLGYGVGDSFLDNRTNLLSQPAQVADRDKTSRKAVKRGY